MNDEDRRYLTEWGGECWHEPDRGCAVGLGTSSGGIVLQICTKCGVILSNTFQQLHENRTFDTWNDFGWLMERLCTTKLLWNFVSRWRRVGMCWMSADDVCERYWDTPITPMVEWESLKPGIRCQLICDFLREKEITDTLAIKEQEEKG
jgi:hypothetical protein